MGLMTHFNKLRWDWPPILTTALTHFPQLYPPYSSTMNPTALTGPIFHIPHPKNQITMQLFQVELYILYR